MGKVCMTLPEAEALYCLACYEHIIAAHGERDSTRTWKRDALHRLMRIENAAAKAKQFEQIEARAP